MAEALRVERERSCWSVTLNRPEKANALSAELVESLITVVTDAARESVPVLAFRGEGRNLSAGFDFTGYEQASEGDLLLRFVRIETLLQALARSPCLTVAFAHGRNFGAGVDLFAACRWRIAAPEATFRMPGLAFGLVLGSRRFAAIVGIETARSILENLETFAADRAHAIGFVKSIRPQEDWPAVLDEARQSAAALAPAHRALLQETLGGQHDDADMAALVHSATAPGLKQRIAAYLAK